MPPASSYMFLPSLFPLPKFCPPLSKLAQPLPETSSIFIYMTHSQLKLLLLTMHETNFFYQYDTRLDLPTPDKGKPGDP